MEGNVKAFWKYLVLAILTALVFGLVACAGSAGSSDAASYDDDDGAQQSTVEVTEYAPFVFEVVIDESLAYTEDFAVEVSGATDAGEEIDDFYRAKPNELYALDYGPGTYTFSLYNNEIEIDNAVYAADSLKVAFSGDKELVATLEVLLDEKATAAKKAEEEAKKAEEEKRKAEAEAKAKEEEEAKRKAEEETKAKEEAEAAAKAEEEAKAQAEAEAAAATAAAAEAEARAQEEPAAETVRSTTSNEVTYIGNRNSHKFHHPWCDSVSKMKESNKVFFYGDRQELINDGYVPCKNCNP